jgi:hypothetical protein
LINPTLPAISKLPDCSNRTRVILRNATSHSEYLPDREIHLILRRTTDLTLWVLHPSTGLPTPPDSAILTIPAALQLLEATHLISHERGLLCIPPRHRGEPEPWENHPIIQSLLKRLQSKWRTHRAQATTLPTAPKPQPRQATPAQNQAATTWLLTPQTVHIGPLSIYMLPPIIHRNLCSPFLVAVDFEAALTISGNGSGTGSTSIPRYIWRSAKRPRHKRATGGGRNGSPI